MFDLFSSICLFFSFSLSALPPVPSLAYTLSFYVCAILFADCQIICANVYVCTCVCANVSLAISLLLYIYCHSPFASEITAHNNLIYGIFTVRLFYCQFNSDRSTTSMPNTKCRTPNQIETQIERNLRMYRVQCATSTTEASANVYCVYKVAEWDSSVRLSFV